MLHIDGSMGEGGGQIVRSALALSAATGTPVTVDNVRAGRSKPGLLRQHAVALEALSRIASARVSGGELGSPRVTFEPGAIRAGEHHLAVGTAGSTLLVLQAALPALLLAPGPSRLVLEGGTHNPFAPPFEFVDRVLVPHLRSTGAEITLTLERHGFYPAGGGRMVVDVTPAAAPRPLLLETRPPLDRPRATILIANLGERIAKRERDTLAGHLDLPKGAIAIERIESNGPGNVILVALDAGDTAFELVASFGQRGRSAEQVALHAAKSAQDFLASGAPVGVQLADQLLVPLALLAGGRFRTGALSAHARTNAAVVNAFLPGAVEIHGDAAAREAHTVSVARS